MSPLSTNYTKEQQEEISILRNELYDLRKKRDYLIHKIAANDHFARTNGTKFPSGNIYSRHYVYDDKLEDEKITDYNNWKDTFFFVHREIASELTRSVMTKEFMDQLALSQINNPFRSKPADFAYGQYLSSVEVAFPDPAGPRLLLADPCGSLYTDPIPELTLSDAQELVGKIVIARVGHQYGSDRHPVKDLFDTGYFKYDPALD